MKNLSMILISLLLISGCSQTNSVKNKDFKEIINHESLSKIDVIDGRNGKRYSFTDKDKIQQFNYLLNEREYKEIRYHEKTKGYLYQASLYSDDKEFSVTFLESEIKINDNYYSLNKPISEKEISDLLEKSG